MLGFFLKGNVMKTRVTIVGSEKRENLYPVAGGQPRKVVSYKCKCILHGADGVVDVGTLTVPESVAPEGVLPGDYLIDYRAGRGFSEDKIMGILHSIEPFAAGRSQPKPEAPQPQQKAA